MVGICRLVGKHIVTATHYPRLKIDKSLALDVFDVGITPIGILIVGDVMFEDKHHLLRREKIGVTEVAGTSGLAEHPIPIARILKQAVVHLSGKLIASILKLSYRLLWCFLFLFLHNRYIRCRCGILCIVCGASNILHLPNGGYACIGDRGCSSFRIRYHAVKLQCAVLIEVEIKINVVGIALVGKSLF